MAKSLQELLGYVTLTGIIQATTPGIPDVLPPGFKNIKKKVLLDAGRYTQVYGNRQTARLAQYGAPARNRKLAQVDIVDVKLLHSIESLNIDPKTFVALRQKDSYQQDVAFEEVARQVAFFKDYFANLRTASTLMALVNGAIYFDESGNLLPSSSGADETVEFQIPANNQNQLNGIIDASWANFSTDIPTQIRTLKQQAAIRSGYPLKYAFYGANVPSYLTNNNYVVEYMARNTLRNNEFLSDAELPNLFGLTWMPAYEAFYQDNDDTNQVIIGDDDVVFTPEPTSGWYELLEGTYYVPTTINIQTDAVAALNSLKEVPGMFAYGQVSTSPVGILMTMGDTMIPTIKVGAAIFQAQVANY